MKTTPMMNQMTQTTGTLKTSEIDEDLKDLSESTTSEQEEVFKPLEPGRKRRSRIKPETKKLPEQIQAFFDEKALGYLINFPFDYLARVHKNPSLKLTDEERKTLTELTNKVITKRMPEFLAKFSDEIALAIAFSSITIPRILLIRETKKIQIKNTSASQGKPEV